MCQTTVVEGHVRDALTNEGLPFVNLAFKGSKIGTSTDINGYYRIESYYATDSLVCSYVGYKRMTKRVRRDREQKVDFLLETSSVELQEVVVRASEWENPAHEIIRNVQKYRKVNNREKLEAYEYEVY
ncbi:MAG: carboxypeptidase-like regulatory domain-containing protein, partial [Flavobacteriales bacterium]|nr:carboxypeptidase-like regulatory domain-containing protein [Flavobacteriales bacterium]